MKMSTGDERNALAAWDNAVHAMRKAGLNQQPIRTYKDVGEAGQHALEAAVAWFVAAEVNVDSPASTRFGGKG